MHCVVRPNGSRGWMSEMPLHRATIASDSVYQRHKRKILRVDLGRIAIHRRARQRQHPTLPGYWQRRVHALDHRAPFRPAQLPSFRAKKSFSTFNWPICRYRRSTCASLVAPSAGTPPSKTLTAPSNSCFFQLWIWFGWTPKCTASSATVRSPLIAASATFALNAALCFCRVRFIFLLPRYPRFLGAGLHLSYLSHFRGPAQTRDLQLP